MGSSKTQRAILHVDMDAFYASIEQRDDPSLKGRPVIVGGTSGRGVVAAASYEVRKFGVHSAMPVSTALRLCPHAICVKPRMALYQSVSKQIFGIFHEFTPLVEGLSLDEAFLDVTASLPLMGDAVAIARSIKARIFETTHVTASVGVAPNKLVAKIASDLKKPDGLTVVTQANARDTLGALSVRRLPGLGRKTGAKVEEAGIHTLAELRSASDAVLWPIFGRYTHRVRERAAGIDERPVISDHEDKSISAEDTFFNDIADPARLQSELASLADRTCTRLRKKALTAGCVTVKIRRKDFTTFTRQKRVSPATNDTRAITGVASALLKTWLAENPGVKVRLLGVGVSQFAEADQLDLFAAPAPNGTSALDTTLDAIRQKFGPKALTRAGNLDDKT
ncbi:MAG TPA: DNA polymerase IV [Steroidobacteraceae bacterium]|jgi:DNA polymerase-4|nr:DNA polymerase IV [Steroidobacteraceae bacterium]